MTIVSATSQMGRVSHQSPVNGSMPNPKPERASPAANKDWAGQGEGTGNFMCYGDFPADGSTDISKFLVPRGIILDRDISTIHELDLNAEDQIQEYVAHSYYDYEEGKDKPLHPYDGETKLNYEGPKPPYKQLNVDKSY